MSDDLIYEAPPIDGRRSALTVWLDKVRAASDGEWVKYPEPINAGTAGNYTRKDESRPGFEIARRTVDASGNRAPDGKCWLYARTPRLDGEVES